MSGAVSALAAADGAAEGVVAAVADAAVVGVDPTGAAPPDELLSHPASASPETNSTPGTTPPNHRI
jgi:hypothetical protein